MRQIEIYCINGKPGCGKDTQAEKILELSPQDSQRISTGEIYRGARSPNGIYGQFYPRIKPYIESVDRGSLLPDKIIFPIVTKILTKKIKEEYVLRFIFTGFPRTLGQLYMTDIMTRQLDAHCHHLYYQLSDEISLQRAQKRREYCIAQGQEIRADDLCETVQRRLNVFYQQTKPMLDLLQYENRLLTIDASGTIEEIAKTTRMNILNLN